MNRKLRRTAAKIHRSTTLKVLGLCMIVKNESKLILRCLESVRPLVDYVLVEDTGSTDGTQTIIREWLARAGLPGEVYDEPWQDFAYNRSHALARLRERKSIDYALILDADDYIVFDSNFDIGAFKKTLSKDVYEVELRQGLVRYGRPQICSNRCMFRYRGVLHEFLESPPASSAGSASGFYISSDREGARSQDPDKYRKDARILEMALQTEKDKFLISRYTFYLARSYRDARENEKALENYLKRAPLGHGPDEVFMSLYDAAQLQQAMDRPFDEIIATYLHASDVAPWRAEALHGASRLCRENKSFAQGYEFARRGLNIPLPTGGLFVEPWIYEYGLLDELAVNAYWSGRYRECLDACDRLLREGKNPDGMRYRIEQNGRFAREKISSQQADNQEVDGDATQVHVAVNEIRREATAGSAQAIAMDRLYETARADVSESETFLKLIRIARDKERIPDLNDEVLASYEQASQVCPARAEALHDAARFCRNKGLYEQGYEYAKKGLAIPRPTSGLSIEDWIYDYGLLDELAVNAYWTERYEVCRDACERLLQENKMPVSMQDRVRKNAKFAVEKIRLRDLPPAKPTSTWTPETPSAGTELMVAGLKERMGNELDCINLRANHPGHDMYDKRPRVVWMHHDVDQRWVQWCNDKELVDSVNRFVFASYWQKERYLSTFKLLPPQRCIVLRHALDINPELRRWEAALIWRCAYTSTPFRGLGVLLDAWERINPANAELHIWSSMKLYLEDDRPYQHLFARAQSLSGVVYRGLVPNADLRTELRTMHFLVYPCTFSETACLAAIEAMAAGCRLIIPSLGALPETTSGYARIYPSNPDAEDHAKVFAENLAAEMTIPWGGDAEMSVRQQAHCMAAYSWPSRLREWRELIQAVCAENYAQRGPLRT
jgi:glycosyltransferase involved in cell wall biosynthesis